MLSDTVLLSRLQFAFTTLFHMLFPLLSVGLSAFLVVTEALWVRTGEAAWYHHSRFWARLLLVNFAVGVASGLVLEFQFGTNWARFSAATGGFFGDILGFEATMAFMLEAAFIGVMMFGWNRVGRTAHLFATVMVAFGASLSAFWILVANSWMQTPSGGVFRDGIFQVTSYTQAILNPNMPWGTSHMWVACLETTLFAVGGVSAWYLRRGRLPGFFLRSFRIAVAAAILIAPLQIFLGDGAGFNVGRNQPAKLAAMEAHWETNPPGQPASWAALAWPDPARERNAWALEVPWLGSLLNTRTLTGQVTGLKEFPPGDRPPVAITFYAFRAMVLIGVLMLLLMIWTVVVWARGGLREESVGRQRRLLRAWTAAIPLGFLATDLGWTTREVGRQPWVIYGLLRTGDGVSPLPAPAVAGSLAVYFLAYTVLLAAFLFFTGRILRRGPDLDLPLPAPRGRRGRGPGGLPGANGLPGGGEG